MEIFMQSVFPHFFIFAALCSQTTFSKSPGKSPPRKSKMDIFKMSKMKIFRILLFFYYRFFGNIFNNFGVKFFALVSSNQILLHHQ